MEKRYALPKNSSPKIIKFDLHISDFFEVCNDANGQAFVACDTVSKIPFDVKEHSRSS